MAQTMKVITSPWENNHVKSCRQAFTILEILLVVVVIGVVATIAAPRLIRRPPSAEWENVVEEVNNLVVYARQEAIANYKTYRLHFTISREELSVVQVEQEQADPEKPDRKLYVPIKSYYFNPRYKFPESIMMHAVYHTKANELDENNQHAYCYVIPNGLVQQTWVHLERDVKGKKSRVTFEMLPFFGKFVVREGFVKPRR